MTAAQVTLKLATSLDGRIATASGESQWITGPEAREAVHRLRAEHDAVLVGSQTVIDDDPLLTVRLPDFDAQQPLRVVADARLRTAQDARLYQSSSWRSPVCLLTRLEPKGEPGTLRTGPANALDYLDDRSGLLVSHCEADPSGRGLDPQSMLDRIIENFDYLEPPRRASPARILIEGGGTLAASFLRAGLVDRIEWFRAPIALGAEGRPALGELGVMRLADAPRFIRLDAALVGPDIWERYEAAPAKTESA